jgi:transposase
VSDTDDAFDLVADSLFVGAGAQQELFDRAADFFCRAADPSGLPDTHLSRNPTFSADFLAKRHPEKYNLIVWMRVQGMPLRYTARIAEVSPNTVEAVDRKLEASGDVETARKMLAANARYLARLTLERIAELLQERDASELDEGKLANLFKHLIEKSELLVGNATERHEWKAEPPKPSDYERFIAGTIDVTGSLEMRPGAEKSDVRARLAAGSDEADLVPVQAVEGGDEDA